MRMRDERDFLFVGHRLARASRGASELPFVSQRRNPMRPVSFCRGFLVLTVSEELGRRFDFAFVKSPMGAHVSWSIDGETVNFQHHGEISCLGDCEALKYQWRMPKRMRPWGLVVLNMYFHKPLWDYNHLREAREVYKLTIAKFRAVIKWMEAGCPPDDPLTKTTPKTERGKVTNALRYEILSRDEFQCVFCGASGREARLRVDHIVPVAAGGLTEKENLQTLCDICNSGKRDSVV